MQQVEADTAKFAIQKIYINDNTNSIMKILENSMKKHNITELSLASVTLDERDGLKGKVLLCTEYMTGSKYGYESMSLPEEEVELDPVLKGIYDDYQTYLNEVYYAAEKSAVETEKGKITSRYVLVRELLLRSVVSALKVKSNLEHGNNMMNFIDDFIAGLLKSQILLHEVFSTENLIKFSGFSLRNKELSAFDLAFSSPEHRDKLSLIRKAIEMSNLIHLPKIAIQQAANYLKKLRHIIAAHILVVSNFDIVEEEKIGKSFIQNTFQDFEIKACEKSCTIHLIQNLSEENDLVKYKNSYAFSNNVLYYINNDGIFEQIIINNGIKFSKAISEINKCKFETIYLSHKKMVELMTSSGGASETIKKIVEKYKSNNMKEIKEDNWHTTELTSSQQRIIEFEFEKDSNKLDKLVSLYKLFVKTNILIHLAEYLSTLISGVNWVLILSGYINIDNLNWVISKHSDDCRLSVFVDRKYMEERKGKLSYKSLVKYFLSDASFSPTTTCNTLSLLNQPEVIRKFLEKMKDTTDKLKKIDDQIDANFNCNVINTGAGKKLFSSFSEKSVQQEKKYTINPMTNYSPTAEGLLSKPIKIPQRQLTSDYTEIKDIQSQFIESKEGSSVAEMSEKKIALVRNLAEENENGKKKRDKDKKHTSKNCDKKLKHKISRNKFELTSDNINIEDKKIIANLNQILTKQELQLKQQKEITDKDKKEISRLMDALKRISNVEIQGMQGENSNSFRETVGKSYEYSQEITSESCLNTAVSQIPSLPIEYANDLGVSVNRSNETFTQKSMRSETNQDLQIDDIVPQILLKNQKPLLQTTIFPTSSKAKTKVLEKVEKIKEKGKDALNKVIPFQNTEKKAKENQLETENTNTAIEILNPPKLISSSSPLFFNSFGPIPQYKLSNKNKTELCQNIFKGIISGEQQYIKKWDISSSISNRSKHLENNTANKILSDKEKTDDSKEHVINSAQNSENVSVENENILLQENSEFDRVIHCFQENDIFNECANKLLDKSKVQIGLNKLLEIMTNSSVNYLDNCRYLKRLLSFGLDPYFSTRMKPILMYNEGFKELKTLNERHAKYNNVKLLLLLIIHTRCTINLPRMSKNDFLTLANLLSDPKDGITIAELNKSQFPEDEKRILAILYMRQKLASALDDQAIMDFLDECRTAPNNSYYFHKSIPNIFTEIQKFAKYRLLQIVKDNRLHCAYLYGKTEEINKQPTLIFIETHRNFSLYNTISTTIYEELNSDDEKTVHEGEEKLEKMRKECVEYICSQLADAMRRNQVKYDTTSVQHGFRDSKPSIWH